MNENTKDISECAILSVNDESGDATFFSGGFVYVVDESKPVEGNVYNVSELDDISDDDHAPEALVYAVSLEDLVKAAHESGLLDKLARKTRFSQ